MRALSSLLVLGSIVGVCLGQFQFLNPDGNQDDFSQTFSNGDVIDIKWNKTWKGVGAALKTADLWITWFDESSFSQLLESNVNFKSDGELKWTANLSDATLKHTPRYVFRLKPHTSPPLYSDIQNESPSRGFNLIPSTQPLSTSVSSSSHSATATSSATASTSASTAAASSDSSSPTLSSGAIAGIAVGGVAVIALFAFGTWFLLRYRRNTAVANPQRYEADSAPARIEAGDTAYAGAYKPPVFAGTYQPLPPAPVEADGYAVGQPAAELYGDGGGGSGHYGQR
ncbi:hypothetical protein BU16DRAFT_331484 [Lophium mytilinum]|uniref:Mid2 domain-containing protein n=1 Tax=Lophium mytilinum TaxID=390894 RepID=A0A6A6R2D0_9PEZI|nr:hypothetical protein BU16DRAFT_331484 [Lophium mytilinum]